MLSSYVIFNFDKVMLVSKGRTGFDGPKYAKIYELIS